MYIIPNFIRFWCAFYGATKRMADADFGYFAVTRHGVPSMVVFCAKDRAAWQAVQFALDYALTNKIGRRP